jgi:hemerythrin superfamily protein
VRRLADIFELLETDHQEVKGMLAALEKAPGATSGATPEQLTERRNQVDKLTVEESKHEAAEEQYFWPTVRERIPDGEGMADKAIHQETEGKKVLDKLDGMSPDNVEFESLLAKFIKAGREHIAFEEEQVWPPLKKALTKEECRELGEKFEQAKKLGPTRPHPGTPPNPAVLKTAGAVAGAMDKARDAMTGRADN